MHQISVLDHDHSTASWSQSNGRNRLAHTGLFCGQFGCAVDAGRALANIRQAWCSWCHRWCCRCRWCSCLEQQHVGIEFNLKTLCEALLGLSSFLDQSNGCKSVSLSIAKLERCLVLMQLSMHSMHEPNERHLQALLYWAMMQLMMCAVWWASSTWICWFWLAVLQLLEDLLSITSCLCYLCPVDWEVWEHHEQH